MTPGADDSWYGTEQQFIYKLNSAWSAGLRYEWVRDNGGARIAGVGDILGTDKAWLAAPGFSGAFSDLSLGLNWRPHPNFTLRPEVRWDWYAGPNNPNANPSMPAVLPFGRRRHASQFTIATDLIFTF